MSKIVDIRLNGHQVDYSEIKSIPLSLRKRTDKFLEIVGADGSEVDNVLKSLALPDTPRNQTTIMTLMAQSSFGRGSTRLQVLVSVNGIVLFSGPGILNKTSKRSRASISYAIELLGDGIGLWEKLDNILLTDLDLGILPWTFAGVTATWSDTTFTAHPGYWCPVVYGNVKGDGYFWLKDFRPSVPYWRIVKAMFEGQGYTIHSDFYETSFFKRLAYTFGVGDKWKIADDDIADYRFRGSFGHSYVWSTVSAVGVLLVTNSISDPSSMLVNNDPVPKLLTTPPNVDWVNSNYQQRWEIQKDGVYRFKVVINAADPVTMQVGVVRGSTTIVDDSYNVEISDDDAPGVTVEFELLLETGDKVFLIAQGEVSGGGSLAELRSTRIAITLLNTPFLGADIDVASCLHDNPVKDFLRGMSHQLNLAWAVDDITKRVFFEPRFDYGLTEAGSRVWRKGFYRRDYELINGAIDAAEVSMEYASPFGDFLKLGYKPDGNDPMEKATLNDLGRKEKVPPYTAKAELHDRGKTGQTSLNPYFTTLYQSQPSGIKLRVAAYLPTILPSSYKRGDKLPGIVWMDGDTERTQDPPTFESEPKCGIMFPKCLSFSFYYTEGAEALYYSPTVLAPWITQHKWIDIGGSTGLDDYDNVPCYADLMSLDTPRLISGLVSTFYPNYISIIKEGQVLSGNLKIPLPTIASLSFRRMWRLPYDLNESVWILLELTGYKALLSDDCNGAFIKYVPPLGIDMESVEHDDPGETPVVPDIAPIIDE